MSMEDDAVVTAVVPDETPAATEPPAGDDTPSMEYEELPSGNFRWADGVVTDVEGNVVEEEDETPPAATPTATAKPEKSETKLREEKPVAQPTTAPAQNVIYTTQNVHDFIYSDKVQEELADLQSNDPARYVHRTLGLQQQYNLGIEQLRNHAAEQFDEQVSQAERDMPEVFARYGAKLERSRRRMSPEQLQFPGEAKRILKDLMANDGELMEAAMRWLTSKDQPLEKKPVPVRTTAVVNKAVNMPGPGTARKATSGTPEPRRINPRIAHIMKFHEVSEEEAKKLDYDLQHPGGR